MVCILIGVCRTKFVEGFTFSLIQKPTSANMKRIKPNDSVLKHNEYGSKRFRKVLPAFQDDCLAFDDHFYIFPNKYVIDLQLIRNLLRVIKFGVQYGISNKKNIQLQHEFAVSQTINRLCFPLLTFPMKRRFNV